jgi:hypothetical protein
LRQTVRQVRFRRRSKNPLTKKARRGFRGYPVATIALYGPDDRLATKVAVGIVVAEEAEPYMRRWFAFEGDIRADRTISAEIGEFIKENGAKSVIATGNIIGCPHEEGIDYPEGAVCPQCPFWANRSMSGELIE